MQFFFFEIFNPLFVYIYACLCGCLLRPEEAIWSPRNGVIGDPKQQEVLTVETSVLVFINWFWDYTNVTIISIIIKIGELIQIYKNIIS